MPENIVFFFYLTISVDSDEMQSRECSIMLHFILVFTVCKSFHSGFPEYKGLINVINGFFSDHIVTRDRGAAGSSLTGVTALWSLSKTHLS